MSTTTNSASRPAGTAPVRWRSDRERRRDRQVALRVVAVLVVLALACIGYLTWDVQATWSYALDLRGRQLGALLVVGTAIGASSLAFQTIAGNRILTPSIMGFDSVYVLIQTVLVVLLGAGALGLGIVPRFLLNSGVLTLFGVLLFRWLFRRESRNLFVLVLVGIVLGTFFGSFSTLASRVLNPDDFLTLQQLTFASFTTVDPVLLGVTAVTVAVTVLAIMPLTRSLDLVDLGRDNALTRGVDHHRVITRVLICVTLMVAASAALVGPMLFLGLIVANLTRQIIPTHHHHVLVPASAAVGALSCVVGQFLMTHVFSLSTPLAVVINLIGGIYFILLLLRSSRL